MTIRIADLRPYDGQWILLNRTKQKVLHAGNCIDDVYLYATMFGVKGGFIFRVPVDPAYTHLMVD